MLLWILRISALIFLIWFIAPVFKGYFNFGNKLGIAMCVFVLLFLTNKELFEYTKNLCNSYSVMSVIWQIGKYLLIAFCVYATLVTIAMIAASLIKPQKNSTAITLGIRAERDGPSDLLKGRIDATAVYLKDNPSSIAVLSGGKCKRDYICEAQCMYDTLIFCGVDKERLVVENRALSTYENILFSKRIIDELDKEKNLAIVSDRFHQLRARLIAKKLGIKSKVGAVNSRTSFLYIPTYYVREWIALPYEVLFRFRPHR